MTRTVRPLGEGGDGPVRAVRGRLSRAGASRGAVVLVGAAVASVMTMPGGSVRVGAQTAPVVSGVERVLSVSLVDSEPVKSAFARCPDGKAVVGGGATASTEFLGADPERLTLTQLQPTTNIDGQGGDAYVVSAAETSPGVSGDWGVAAYAICADSESVPGWEIVTAHTTTSSAEMQSQAAVCPSGKSVLGTGASVSHNGGQVRLQVARSSDPGDIARAQAHEQAGGYPRRWSLAAYAICANTPTGYQVVTGPSDEAASEQWKFATAICPEDKQMLSPGAAITDIAPGHVSLQVVFPDILLRAVHVRAVENTPLNNGWDRIIARGICVDRP
jgi:hypothetical protein